MRFIEGRVWSIWILYVHPTTAAKITKRVYVVANTLEAATALVKGSVALHGQVEYASVSDTYDGIVVAE